MNPDACVRLLILSLVALELTVPRLECPSCAMPLTPVEVPTQYCYYPRKIYPPMNNYYMNPQAQNWQ